MSKKFPVKLYCSNGKFLWKEGENATFQIKANTVLWDDMSIHRKLGIPEGTILDVKKCYQNLYGTFIEVDYMGIPYSVKPKYCHLIIGED